MKLFEIAEFEDDSNTPDKYRQKNAARYMWTKLYATLISNSTKSKHLFWETRDKLIKYSYLWIDYPDIAYRFARFVLREPWPQAEPTIARSSRWAYEYAVHVLSAKFPAGETAIRSDPQYYDKYKKKFGKIKLPGEQLPKAK